MPSPKVATYEETPQMSAAGITDRVVEEITEERTDFVIANFANPDMVGHTGDMAATVAAVDYVDGCLQRIASAVLAQGGALLITADHGNAEQKVDSRDNSPLTAHTTNPVPVLLCGSDAAALRPGGSLCDVAPTVLQVMGLPVPEAMTGRSLVAEGPSLGVPDRDVAQPAPRPARR